MTKTDNDSLYCQALVEGGLTPNQAKMYEALVKHGKLPASKTSRLANVPRTLGYKALQELQTLELVEKEDIPNKVALFSAAHPFKLKEVADKRYEQGKNAKEAVEGVLGKLISDFNTRAGAPGLRVLEGISGMAELYEDILNEQQTMKLIRSPKDRKHPELGKLIQNQIEGQKKLGMKTLAITPVEEGAPYEIIAHDTDRLTTRRIVPQEKLSVPAQIVIYGNKVAITAYEPAIITTLIENPAIQQTFEMLFDYLWERTEQDHGRILASLKK